TSSTSADVPYLGLEGPGEGAVPFAASPREASASRDGEQKDRVGHGFHAVSGFRYGQEVSRTSLPARVPGYEPHPALHHQHGGVTGGVMLAELRSFGQGDHRLPQALLVTAVDRLCGPAAAFFGCAAGQLAGHGFQTGLLHLIPPVDVNGSVQWRTSPTSSAHKHRRRASRLPPIPPP